VVLRFLNSQSLLSDSAICAPNGMLRAAKSARIAPLPAFCKTARADLLRADYMDRTGLGRRSMGATLGGKCALGHGRITIMLLPGCALAARGAPRAAPIL